MSAKEHRKASKSPKERHLNYKLFVRFSVTSLEIILTKSSLLSSWRPYIFSGFLCKPWIIFSQLFRETKTTDVSIQKVLLSQKIVTEADDGLLRTFLPKQRKLMLEANEGSISKEESEERILFFMLLLAVILASMSSIFTIKEEQSL